MQRTVTILAILLAVGIVGGAALLLTQATDAPPDAPVDLPVAGEAPATMAREARAPEDLPDPVIAAPSRTTTNAAANRTQRKAPPTGTGTATKATGALHGKVRFDDDEPCANVSLRLRGARTSRNGSTDEDGVYRFEGIAPGPHVLTIASATFPTVTSTVTIPAQRDVEHDVRVPGGLSIHGTVRNIFTSRPVANATITLTGKGIAPRTTCSDADGNYTVTRLYEPHRHVKIVAENYEERRERFMVNSGEGGRSRQDITLHPWITIRGRVTPGAHAKLTLVRFDGSPPEPIGETALDGSFHLILRPARSPYVAFMGAIVAEAPGGRHGESDRIPLLPGIERGSLTIKLASGGSVSGHVFDDDGPRAGLAVELECIDSLWTTPIKTTSDDEGAFRVAHVPVGTWRATASAGSKRGTANRIAVRPREHTRGVELSLVEGGTLEGAVVDTAGKPIRGAHVRAGDRITRTDKEGIYRLRGLPKRVTLTVDAKHYAVETRERILTDAAVEAIVLKRIHAITGHVWRADDNPATDFWIHVYRASGPGRAVRVGRRRITDVTDGRFTFDVPAPGQHYVLARTPDGLVSEMTGVRIDLDFAAVPLAIRLLDAGTLSGEVRGSDGKPIANAVVSINRKPSGWARSFETTLNGRFRAPAIAVGSYEISVRHDAWFGAKKVVVIGSDDPHHVDLVLERGGALVVAAQDGFTAVVGAKVEIYRGDSPLTIPVRYPIEWEHLANATEREGRKRFKQLDYRMTHTGEGGVFVRSVLEPGHYRLRIRRKGYRTAERRVHIEERKASKIIVTLEHGSDDEKPIRSPRD